MIGFALIFGGCALNALTKGSLLIKVYIENVIHALLLAEAALGPDSPAAGQVC